MGSLYKKSISIPLQKVRVVIFYASGCTLIAPYSSSRLRKRNETIMEHSSHIRMQCFILLIKKILIEGPIITSFYVNLPY